MKLKVLHIIGSLNIGGAENLLLDLARYAYGNADSPVEFRIVYMHSSLPERVELFSSVLVDKPVHIPCSKGAASTFRFIKTLRKYIIANKIDEIHCHNNVDAYWACFASRFTGVKRIVLTVHGLNLNFRFLSGKMGGFAGLERSLLKRLSIKYVSGVTQDFYRRKYGWRELEGEVVYNGIDWRRFECAKKCRMEDEAWMRDGRAVFLMAGSFNPSSRLQILVCRALAKLRNEGPLPFVFVFAGAKNPQYPHLYDECTAFCRDTCLLDKDVFFLGGRSDIPSIMASVQGYVYASESDTFGLSVVEAAGCGLPVVCSDIPALGEVLGNGKYGTLVANDEEIFAKEILSLYAGVENVGSGNAMNSEKAVQLRAMYSIKSCFEGYYGKI